MLKTLGEIIAAIRDKETEPGEKKKNQKDFGVELGLSPDSAQSNISQYERNLTQPNFETLCKLLSHIDIDLLKLINEKLSGKPGPFDVGLNEDLQLAAEVLKSPFSFSSALRSNIHSFHEAVEDKKQLIDEIKAINEKLSRSAENPSSFTQRPESGPDTTDLDLGEKHSTRIPLKNQKTS